MWDRPLTSLYTSFKFVAILYQDASQILGGAWVAQLAEQLTLGFSSGHDLKVHESKAHIRLPTGGVEPAWDFSLSLSLCPCLDRSLCLSK